MGYLASKTAYLNKYDNQIFRIHDRNENAAFIKHIVETSDNNAEGREPHRLSISSDDSGRIFRWRVYLKYLFLAAMHNVPISCDSILDQHVGCENS